MKASTISTARFITILARETTACKKHGQVVRCKPFAGRMVERGFFLPVSSYLVNFEDGAERVYSLRGGRALNESGKATDGPQSPIAGVRPAVEDGGSAPGLRSAVLSLLLLACSVAQASIITVNPIGDGQSQFYTHTSTTAATTGGTTYHYQDIYGPNIIIAGAGSSAADYVEPNLDQPAIVNPYVPATQPPSDPVSGYTCPGTIVRYGFGFGCQFDPVPTPPLPPGCTSAPCLPPPPVFPPVYDPPPGIDPVKPDPDPMQPVPEPATYLLCGVALIAISGVSRCRNT